MTDRPDQPPYGEPPRPPVYGQPYGGPPPVYPQANLLPQEVQRGRNRKPLVIGLALALVLVAGGVGAYFLLRDDGEGTRAAYCAALKEATNEGDLISALAQSSDSEMRDDLDRIRDLAPRAVRSHWDRVYTAVQSLMADSETINFSQLASGFGSLQEIATDARDNCGLQLDVGF
jgi:hypothetical protein